MQRYLIHCNQNAPLSTWSEPATLEDILDRYYEQYLDSSVDETDLLRRDEFTADVFQDIWDCRLVPVTDIKVEVEDDIEYCPHEGDIEYGKSIDITDTKRAIQILCSECGAVGTQIEEQDNDDQDHFEPIGEMWHELPDYYANRYINERNYKGIGVQRND